MSLANLVISTIIFIIFYIYITQSTINKKIDVKNFTVCLSIILSTSFVIITFLTFDNFVRTVTDFVILFIACKFIFKETFVKSFIVCFFVFVYFFLAEVIFGLFLVLILKMNALDLKNMMWIDGSLANFLVGVVAIIISKLKVVKNTTQKAIDSYTNYKIWQRYEIFLVIIFVLGILTNKNVLLFGPNFEYLINWILIFFIVYIIYYILKEKQYSTQLSIRYDQLFSYIQRYEKALDKQSMNIHEFKNQLISIKAMASKKNKELNDYLNSIMQDLKNSDCKMLKDMKNINIDGLKGLIYYKLGDLSSDGISVLTKISVSTKQFKFAKDNTEIYKDIIKIMGVLFDNAIESAKNSLSKQITLEIYCRNNKMHILLSNTYCGVLNVEEFDNMGYSTKGKGRGYGLALVKELIKKYSNIEQQREVSGEYYTVHLMIDDAFN